MINTRQYQFKTTQISEQSQQELLAQCPKTVCAAHVIQTMMQKHNARCPYGNVNKKTNLQDPPNYHSSHFYANLLWEQPGSNSLWLSQHFVFTFQQ